MEHGQPSRTAFAAARYRAAHQVIENGRLFADPLAVPILGVPVEELARDERRLMRYFIAARSRFAEDALAGAYRRGIRQVVVLGAGLDTFAYRNPYPDLRVIEVDHPSTQEWKRWRLAEAGIAVPPSMAYVPVDFERQSLAEALPLAEPAFFIWLGVVPYLSREAFAATVSYLNGEVVFDYAEPPETLDPEVRARHAERAARVAALGEPWQLYFHPAELHAALAKFAEIDDLGPAALAARYLNRPGLPERSGGHVLHARMI